MALTHENRGLDPFEIWMARLYDWSREPLMIPKLSRLGIRCGCEKLIRLLISL